MGGCKKGWRLDEGWIVALRQIYFVIYKNTTYHLNKYISYIVQIQFDNGRLLERMEVGRRMDSGP